MKSWVRAFWSRCTLYCCGVPLMKTTEVVFEVSVPKASEMCKNSDSAMSP